MEIWLNEHRAINLVIAGNVLVGQYNNSKELLILDEAIKLLQLVMLKEL